MPPLRTNANPPLRAVFHALAQHFGPQRWWPARSRFEMMVGALLTQNTAWTNVERAIRNLRRQRALSPRALNDAPRALLAQWIRPAGYFNVKAARLHALTGWLMRACGGSLNRLFRMPTAPLRDALLRVPGIGPETADSILLYAGRRPIFVIDAYTRRMLERHRWLSPRAPYDQVAHLFHQALPRDAALFNEYHALIVALGKRYCRARPRCEECPLRSFLPRRIRASRNR